MTEFQHTPGPWRVRHSNNGTYDNTDDGVFDVIARGPYGIITLALEQDQSDAALISAAPDLLEAVILLSAAAQFPTLDMEAALEKGRQAITKATGKELAA